MKHHDVQGTLLGIPYDFRPPTLAKLRARVWRPGASKLSPHLWGWGYSLNLAHPGSWVAVVAAVAVALLASGA